MKKFIDNSVAIVGVLTIMLVTFGITFAWFVSTRESSNEDLIASGKLEIVYDKGEDVQGELIPSSNKDVGINTSVTISKTQTSVNGLATISLTIDTLPLELRTDALNWEVYRNGENTPYQTGNFANVNEGDVINIVEDYEVTTSDTIFTLYLWLDGTKAGNEVMGKTFEGHLSASAYSKGTLE